MANETVELASDHTSTTHEQFVNQEKNESIAEKINSLANEDGDKHDDKPDNAQGQDTPTSKTEGDEVKAELSTAEIEKSDDSSALHVSVEDSPKPDIVDGAQNPAVEKGDEEKAEPAVAVEKTDDSVQLEAVADAVVTEKEKDLIPESETISVTEPVHDAAISQHDEPPSIEPAVNDIPQEIEKEAVETAVENEPKTEDILEAETIEKSVDTTEKSSDATEINQSEGDEVKPAEILETSAQNEEKPEPVATEEPEVTEEPEKESQEKSAEAEQSITITTAELVAEANEDQNNIIEAKTTAEISEETENNEVVSTENGKEESVITEVAPTETGKEETVVAEVEPTETAKEEPVVTGVEPTETGKEEPVVTDVEETKKEPEQNSTEQREEEQPNTLAIPEQSTETNDAISVDEKTREFEFEAAPLKETNIDEAGPTETEKTELVVTEVDEKQSEPEIQPLKQEEEEKPIKADESREQTGDTLEVHPPKDSDIEVVKETETGNSESEAIPIKEENTNLLSNEVEVKPEEQLQAGEEVAETSKEVEPKEAATEKSEASLDDTIKEEESETNTTVNTAQVLLNEEAQTNAANLVEPSPEVEEKVVEEDVKKESSITDVNEGVSSKEVDGVTENLTNVDEKVVIAAEDEKKEPETPAAVQVSSREVEVDIKKAEEQNETNTAAPEAGDADIKVDEISKAVSQTVRETLASKFEEKEEEEPIQTGVDNSEKEQIEEPVKTDAEATKENDTTTASKDLPKETPAKPAQKQSNNLISKVKQSLVKAKKAITGKSPSSKNLSSDPKGDIKVK